MAASVAACPACGGPVEFQVSSSLVTICEFCRSVVARGDRKLEDYGKVAAIVDTGSPLHVGLQGTYDGKGFELVGRVQYRHEAGGVWDEWYAAFPNDRWGWLAESQGKFHFTFKQRLPERARPPELESLQAGKDVALPEMGPFSVAEVGEAQAASAEGDLPFALQPGAAHVFADLSGPGGTFATLDYSQPPHDAATAELFAGREVTLDELGIAATVAAEREAKEIPAVQVACPHCGGSLELRAPDATLRVVCPFCTSLLDVEQGNLSYLKTLDLGQMKPDIPLGVVGTLGGVKYTVIGFLRRSATFDKDYYWSEYLLYQPRIGFRWLIHSDNHWSFGQPVPSGDVRVMETTALFDQRVFKLFQKAVARVRYVLGEFYWRVEVGEEVVAKDFICPPDMLSIETSEATRSDGELGKKPPRRRRKGAKEVNITRNSYLPHAEVEKAFGVTGLHKGWKPAPNQPSPVNNRLFAWWGVFSLILLLLYVIFSSKADPCMLAWALALVSLIPLGALVYRWQFEMTRWSDSEYNPYQAWTPSLTED